jgi:YD repeat-containing protein
MKKGLIWVIIELVLVLLFTSLKVAGQTDVPVNLQDGTPQISIPLGTVTDKGLSLPISLNYISKGVKVNSTEAGEDYVGIGWKLQAGGKIGRKVNGLPDDYISDTRKGWLFENTANSIKNYSLSSDTSQATCTDEIADWNQFYNTAGFKYTDTEPDEFFIELPNISIKFVFDENKEIRTIPYQDIKIIPYYLSNQTSRQISKFEVITNDGIKYVFSDEEFTCKGARPGPDNPSVYTKLYQREFDLYNEVEETKNGSTMYPGVVYNSSWNLTEIISPLNGKITFSYVSEGPIAPFNSVTGKYFFLNEDYKKVNLMKSNNTILPLSYEIVEKTSKKRLRYITAETGDRFYINYYIDDNDGLNAHHQRKLNFVYNSMSFFKGTGKNSESIHYRSFDLSYYVTSDPTQNNPKRRTFLKSVQEYVQCYRFPPFQFSYYGIDNSISLLPEPNSKSKDYWGYYNGAENSVLHPQLTVNGILYNGANRNVNPQTINIGALAKIVYPPGGSVAFEYEPQTYWDGSGSLYGPGIRVKRVKSYDAIDNGNFKDVEYNYNTTTGVSSGYLKYPPVFTIKSHLGLLRSEDNLSDLENLEYEQVTVKQAGKGKIVYQYLKPPTFPQILYDTDVNSSYDDWFATRVKIARNQTNSNKCNIRSYFSSDYYSYPFPKNSTYDFNSGLLSKKIIFNESGKIEQEHLYEYERLTNNPQKVKGIYVDYTGELDLILADYYYLVNVDMLLKSEKTITYDPLVINLKSESNTNYFYESPYHKYLSRTVKQNSDGTFFQTKYKYVKDFPINIQQDEATAALKRMQDNNIINSPVEVISSVLKNGQEKVMGATLTKYKYTGTSFPGLVDEVYQLPAVDVFTPATLINNASMQQFSYDSNYLLLKKVEEYDEVGNPLTISDRKRNKQSFHWGYNKKWPVVEINNASWSEVVYSGWETQTNNEFVTENNLYDPFTGRSGLLLEYPIEKTINLTEGKHLKISCWMRDCDIGYLTVELIGQNTTKTYNFNYTDNCKWRWFEQVFDATMFSGNVTVRITATDQTYIDELALYPADASIKTYTYNPVLGKTSETDARGNITFYQYDNLGRIRFTKDRDNNILTQVDYKFKNDIPPVYSSDFTSNIYESNFYWPEKDDSKIYNQDTWVFRPINVCLPEVSHTWYVNGVIKTTNANLIYQFTSPGQYIIKHKVNHPVYGEKITEVQREVLPTKLIAYVTTSDPRITTWCNYQDNNYQKTFHAEVRSGLSNGPVTYTWYYQRTTPSGLNIQKISGGGTSNNFIVLKYPYDYEVYCVVSGAGQFHESNKVDISYQSDCNIELDE